MTILERRDRAGGRFTFVDCSRQTESFAEAVLNGLSGRQKSIPCRFLYDERGSQLFDRICTLPEYYPTRTETAILTEHAGEIAALIGPEACVVELGSGASVKTRILLDALKRPAIYAPIDVSAEHLKSAADAIARAYPGLRVAAICGDYADDLPIPIGGRTRVAFFPGSTIGNLEHAGALSLLRRWRNQLGEDGMMILGADLQKSATIIEAAYNDAAGVTEAFIKNILVRINRELGGDIELDGFGYEARYVAQSRRVEMHLRSRAAQEATICGRRIAFAAGERIHVENSHKYTIAEMTALGREAGFAPVAHYVDREKLFSVHVWSGV
jgi:dimethylhistidine N-methyltransferase